jgi:APA family basic amino acid/polyamine antiporter
MSTSARVKQLGFWMCTALVVGNMIGSGIFMLPASLAPFGASGLLAWVLVAIGAVILAYVFSELSRVFPEDGGPYVYTREAFGEFTAFIVMWGYWVAVWVGNAAIATGAISYFIALFPGVGRVAGGPALVTVAFVWGLTWVNWLGVRTAGWVQVVTTLMKLLPMLAIAFLGLAFVRWHQVVPNVGSGITFSGTTAAATLALFTLLGLESATIPAGKVKDPARTIPRATMVGTVLTALISALACTVVQVMFPAAQVAASNAPFADAARLFWGDSAGTLVTVFAAISGFGALNGWILLQAEVPYAMAKSGVFPRVFAQESRHRTPTFALVSTSALVTVLILMNFQKSVVDVFTFMVLLATSANVITYLACAVALLVLLRRGRLGAARRGTPALAVAGVLGALFSFWTLAGAGRSAVLWGLVLMAAGAPVYWLMKRKGASAAA